MVEQNHRVIKRRCVSMTCFESLANASSNISALDLANRLLRPQMRQGRNWELDRLCPV
jgi:transposase-like protein